MPTKKIQVLNSIVATDTTLTQKGKAADAKAVGNAIENIKYVAQDTAPENTNVLWVDTTDNTGDFEQVVIDTTLSIGGCAADSKKTGEAISKKADFDYVSGIELNVLNLKQNVLDLERNDVAQLKSELSSLNKIYIGDTEPTNVADGTIWIDTSEQQSDDNEV
jgi:hypothetical protein